ncbi:H-type lectin domain-containing protein [Photobacterium damselae]|uniref:H-type lectin domain-containing protein n=1 Tax=Photobacterium damselae TaxID=38293 RepID=UPI001EDCD464|nr:H-type lectin domain-containing protein [Photobacterium damselae]MCG3824525.1 hypothetical protein [Photobacterium damselae]
MRYFIILLWLLLSSNNVFAAKHSLNTQSFIDSMDVGRYNVANNHTDKYFCIKNNCTIRFNKTFDTIPVVFLMNTVNFNDENDQPSALMIKSITKSSVTFQQVMAPDNNKPNNVIPKPMLLINYLAVEKGAYKLPNNSYVIVNTIETNKFQYKFGLKSKGFKKPSNYNKWVLVNLHSYSTGIDLKEKPGVLHQKQTANNDMWLTTTVANVDKNKFDIALEKSEIDGYKEKSKRQIPSKEETIGFLAGVGDFSYQDLRMLFGIQKTKDTLQLKDPITSGCGNYVDFTPPFNSIPFIFANKDARNGPDGGWVRLCRSQSDKASFAIDEDMDTDSQRDHQGEIIGYVAISYNKKEIPSDDLCQYFPGVVQSHYHSSLLEMEDGAKIYGNKYKFIMGFAHKNVNGVNKNDSCLYGSNEWLCLIDENKIITPIYFHEMPDYSESLEYWSGNKIIYPGNYDEIVLSNGDFIFEPGNYYINELKVYQNVNILTKDKTNFYIDELKILNNGNNIGSEDINLKIFVTGDDDTYIQGKGNVINALIYTSEDLYMENDTVINGSVSTRNLYMRAHSRINSNNSCINPPVEKNKLIITPQISYGLTCERIPIDFYVYHENGSQNTDFVGNITIKPQKGICWSTSADGYCFSDSSSVPISGGHIKLYMQSLNVGDVYINANLTEDATIMASGGPYRFAPYGFRINGAKDIPLIAGQPKTVSIEAVASSGAQCSIIKDYQGSPQLIFSDMKGRMPQHISQPLNINGDLLTTTKELSQKLSFHNGISNLDLTYSDAGSLSFSVSDPKWVPQHCAQRSSCSDWEDNWPGLQGKGVINSRPWTFAICPAQGKNIDGTALGGQPLSAAGDYFYLHVRPVVWQQGGSESDPISTTAYNLCNAAITPNFFKSDAPRLNVNISLNEKQPVSPVGGDYGQLSGNLQANNHTGNDYLNYRLTWSEVGSVPLKASGQSDYLGMTINSGYRSAGRIYPAFFGFTHNELTPAMGSFTYMGQPFPVHWVVNAFNRQGKAVGNYDKFAPKLTAKFAFDIKNSGSNSEERLLLQQPLPQTWSHNGENHHSYMSYQSDVTFARQGFQALDKVTTPDGPYNSWQLWLTITNPNAGRPAQDPRRLTPELCNPNDGCSDPDLSKMTELRLGNTNPMRYGRMVLQDAAGDIRGPVAIPLRVEYWNGAAFETNADDSSSHFDGRNYCRQILYPQPDKKNIPSTSGIGNVDRGVASDEKLVAYPDVPALEPFKQQVRFWQRLSNSTEPKGNGISCRGTYTYQPWLSYNWRKQGDEDPSAIVTFGVYQGNKRIIYRAEAGVTSSNYQ